MEETEEADQTEETEDTEETEQTDQMAESGGGQRMWQEEEEGVFGVYDVTGLGIA